MKFKFFRRRNRKNKHPDEPKQNSNVEKVENQERIPAPVVDVAPELDHLNESNEHIEVNNLMSSQSTQDFMSASRTAEEVKQTLLNSNPASRSRSVLLDEMSYDAVPILERTLLSRGGVSVATEAVGRVQFGIPPETIKDTMNLGLDVPVTYIVPVDRFCREMGPALGVNLAEFEFPAYFNFFVQKRKCTLVVDNILAEESIRTVFGETLLGPTQFRNDTPIPYEEEDFAPDFPDEQKPDFCKELHHFRVMPDGSELVIETLLNFVHFVRHKREDEMCFVENERENFRFGIAPLYDPENDNSWTNENSGDEGEVEREEYENDEDKWENPVFSGYRYAVVYSPKATEEEKANNSCARVEIFFDGGISYYIHDVNAEGHIIGRSKISSRVYIPERVLLKGFGNLYDDVDDEGTVNTELMPTTLPPSFYPPSFGVTVLGNSHGFDKNGTTSGYVLWINGRGVMIDPPPYSTATLERDGINAGMIVGIILTHCHADHDAGAFQKVLRDRPVAVITTPTIYKSFIRKYAALSGLSEHVLMHCHRHRPAIIGESLKFQGANFHFFYSLHTIPCVGFRVTWRGLSMVFTGDHFNSPDGIAKLQEKGVLTPSRARDLLDMPLQQTDLLLHEAGAPPIHTPLAVLEALPNHVKEHLYVVHTSALPQDSTLKIAPTGTEGTLRLDDKIRDIGVDVDGRVGSTAHDSFNTFVGDRDMFAINEDADLDAVHELKEGVDDEEEDFDRMTRRRSSRKNDAAMQSVMFSHIETERRSCTSNTMDLFIDDDDLAEKRSKIYHTEVMNRPSSSSDAWFILNLMSSVPFFTSLSYTHAMEVLETARVDAFCDRDVVIPASKRKDVLCVFWEGTCMEVDAPGHECNDKEPRYAQWFAGDWTGPIALQPEEILSGNSPVAKHRDIQAVSKTGVKVIKIDFKVLNQILFEGSDLYVKYQERVREQAASKNAIRSSSMSSLEKAQYSFNLVEVLQKNSTFKRLRAVQKVYMESIVDGPFIFRPGEHLWTAGELIDKVYIIVYGNASFMSKDQSLTSNHQGEPHHDKRKQGSGAKSSVVDLWNNGKTGSKPRRSSVKQRLDNQVFSRVYVDEDNSLDYDFGRGNFIGDVSRIVGDLTMKGAYQKPLLGRRSKVGSGEKFRRNLVAGKEGCAAVSIDKENLRTYLDNNPGLLLCLLGTEVVV